MTHEWDFDGENAGGAGHAIVTTIDEGFADFVVGGGDVDIARVFAERILVLAGELTLARAEIVALREDKNMTYGTAYQQARAAGWHEGYAACKARLLLPDDEPVRVYAKAV